MRPSTRSRTKVAQEGSQLGGGAVTQNVSEERAPAGPPFLEKRAFQEALHVPSLYHLDVAGGSVAAKPAVRELGEPAADTDADSGNPFHVVDFNDKRGIWQTDPKILGLLGEDPAKHLRTYANGADRKSEALSVACAGGRLAPAGLVNLGATCYLNSLLQYLFFNVDFRRGLLDASSESVALRAMQRVFAHLAAGDRSTVDTGEFVTAARIDAVEQADATELSALLFDWLERELGRSGEAEATSAGAAGASAASSQGGGGGFVPALFRGEVSQQLQCKAHPEHIFERREHFYELRARLSLEPQQKHEVPWAAGGGSGGSRSSAEAVVVPPVLSAGGEGAEGATAVAGTAVSGGAAAAEAAEAPSASGAARGGKKAAGAAAAKRKRGPPAPRVLLEHLLEDTAFPEENLDGPNQYHCPRCDRKVDARKATRPARLPPYLHVIIERYHYDLRRGERKKLNHVISFPRRLQLRVSAPAPASGTVPVVYECIGFLEHVSDTAQSGHYTATLLQEDADTSPAAASPVAGRAVAAGGGGDAATEPAAKRQCCSGADVAAGTPRGGTWWKLDDDTVSPVTWAPAASSCAAGTTTENTSAAAATAEAARGAPRRIESPAAYLLLYRRADHKPEAWAASNSVASLPPRFATSVAAENEDFARQRQRYAERAAMVELLIAERRKAIDAFARALREHKPRGDGGGHDYSIVPSAWLDTFLRGEEMTVPDAPLPRTRSLPNGGTVVAVPPVLYGRALVPSRAPAPEGAAVDKGTRMRLALDPLSVWCGKVKLVPTAALDALRGAGGLDSSLFLPVSEAMCPQLCRAAWNVFQAWRDEQRQIARVLDGRLSVGDARVMEEQGRGDEVTWVATRVLNMWRRTLATAGAAQHSPSIAQWNVFLSEVHAARWGASAASDAAAAVEDEAGEVGAGAAADASASAKPLQGASATGAPVAGAAGGAVGSCTAAGGGAAATGGAGPASITVGDVVLVAGLLCPHGLLCRSRCGAPVLRADVEALLEAARTKERAYRALWPDAAIVPRVRSGLPGNRLLAFDAVCPECRPTASVSATTAAAAVAPTADRPCRNLLVKRRYTSGVIRKAGTLAVPVDVPLTASTVGQLVLSQLSFTVARLIVPASEAARGAEIELEAGDFLDRNVSVIVVEKDENAVAPEREAAAFESCIFRAASA